MKKKRIEKVIKVLWKETIRKIDKGKMADFEATVK